MEMMNIIFWSVVALFVVFLATNVGGLPAEIVKENALPRQTRETQSLKLELQKLREILRDVHNNKMQDKSTTTVRSVLADDDLNTIISQLRKSDTTSLLELSKALRILKQGDDNKVVTNENNQNKNVDGNSDGAYLGESNEQPVKDDDSKEAPESSQEILALLKNLYNKERVKYNKEISALRSTKIESVQKGDTDLRADVLHAIETRLLKDVGLALNYGFSPEELIKGLQKQQSRRISPRSITTENMEEELKTLELQSATNQRM